MNGGAQTITPGVESRDTFESLLRPILPRAHGLARYFTRNGADAADLVQDAALQAFKNFAQFESGTNFKAWFLRILTNAYFMQHRQKQRRPQALALDDVPELFLFEKTASAGMHAQSENPAAVFMAKVGTEHVVQALQTLPDEFRVVATLSFLEELSYQEIAQILACPVGTVRSRLHRARRLLQRALWQVAEAYGLV